MIMVSASLIIAFIAKPLQNHCKALATCALCMHGSTLNFSSAPEYNRRLEMLIYDLAALGHLLLLQLSSTKIGRASVE
jgi:hypothetical protein